MPATKTCCATVRTIRHLDPRILSALLCLFPEVRDNQPPSFLKTLAPTARDYEILQSAWLAGTMPLDLREVLFYTTFLGSAAGWEHIQEEAKAQQIALDFSTEGFTHAELAIKAWLCTWPAHKSFLKESYSRVRYNGLCPFVYYLPSHDLRTDYKAPTEKTMALIREELALYFRVAKSDPAFRIDRCDTQDEIRFLIRYRGQTTHQESYEGPPVDTGHTFKHEEYDLVAYNTAHGILRMTTNRSRDRAKYRLLFGQMLLGNASVFAANENAVSLEPLKGHCRDIFNCRDIEGLAAMAPTMVAFNRIQDPDQEIVLQANNGKTLWDNANLVPALLPDDTDTVRHAIFRYSLCDCPSPASIAVNQGHTIDYEREGHAPVLEKWMCRRNIIRHVSAATTWIVLSLGRFLNDLDDILPDLADNLTDALT